MDIQVPLMIIDRRGVPIMSAYFQTRGVTYLIFSNARVLMGIKNGEPNIVRSRIWDLGHHEELRNGPENIIIQGNLILGFQ
jgi:hypothetical protein